MGYGMQNSTHPQGRVVDLHRCLVCLSSELEGRETGGRERVGNNWERKERRGKERGERKPESQEEPAHLDAQR